ncbi:DNA polymerase III polC-type [Mycoplasmopsis californica]|uniref:DNA polymerase III PolC-type n=1 Tax=Mycoplasmopsis equigenitalium TaxID=114883 RepID=A0ABY5J4Y9_9BACT|nr:PolC-type DNA polymerase III [Mycoplasmopsis equigenitalium]UUD36951.1 PolC-type DNA polymerase III [Mycoplasmopsis equigenitalium]VEU69754.1 DNA polymerase III polC-type [Mycoplasmopsis californica]
MTNDSARELETKSFFLLICKKLKIDVNWNQFKVIKLYGDFDVEKGWIRELDLTFDTIPNSVEFKKFWAVLNKDDPFGNNLIINVKTPVYTAGNFTTYLWHFYEQVADRLTTEECLLFRKYFGNSFNFEQNGKITFSFENDELKTAFEKIKDDMLKLIHDTGFKTVRFYVTKKKNHDELFEVLEQQKSDNFKNGIYEEIEEEPLSNFSRTFKNTSYQYFKRTISEINMTEDTNIKERVIVRGTIFGNVEYKPVKNGSIMFVFNITDYKDAISFVGFAREKEMIEEFKKLKTGQSYEFKGTTQFKTLGTLQEWNILLNSFHEIDPLISLEKDKTKKPRIEFNVKSNMTVLDGFKPAKAIAKELKEMGLRGMALMDVDSVQNFPEFNNFSTNSVDFSKFYGSTFTTIKQLNNIVLKRSECEENLDDNEYIVFDVETTGLSPILDEVIEFGASVVKGKSIIKNYQFLIKPTHPVSEEITKLTGITNEMLESGLSQKEGIEKIYNIVKNKVTVAHNAAFDMNVILQKFEEYGFDDGNTTFIDTLSLSRIISKDNDKHTLGAVAKRLGITYNTTEAHRGDYDAEVLAKIWIVFKNLLINKKITTITQLSQLKYRGFVPNFLTSEVSVLVKNQEGLKELYKLISQAHTDLIEHKMSKNPLIFFDKLKGSQNLLLGSSTLRSDLYDCLFYRSLSAVRKELENYDYIEITPPHNFTYLEDKFSKEQIKKLLKILVKEATKMGKLVIAVSDARYVYPHEQEIHKVLIHTSGVGNSKHYLYNYKKAQEGTLLYPLQFVPTTNQMIDYFKFLSDPKLINDIVVENTYKLAEQINQITIFENKLFTPIYDNSDVKLKELVYKNAHKQYGEKLPKIIESRIEKEINPILKYGFSVIYWIASKLIQKTRNDGYLAGSRGSVGSSLVAALAGITEINPLPPHYICKKCKYFELLEKTDYTSGFDLPNKMCPNCHTDLYKDGQLIPFETFLGFNADKVPDIDLNFPGEYQPIIHEEVKKMFGEHHTFRAGTILAAQYKTCFGYVKTYAQEIRKPMTYGFTKYLASSIEGTKRTSGQHAGGIVVVPKEYDVEDFTPINYPSNDEKSEWKTTHFNFEAIHESLLKLDLLGHKDPTAIKMLERLTKISFSEIPNMDEKVLSLFRSSKALNIEPGTIGKDTTGAIGLPEFGTSFVRQMLAEVQVESFADLISVSGLSHGTNVWLNNAQNLIKEGNKKIKDVISCRDDVMNYLMKKGIKPLVAFQIMENVRKKNGTVTPEQEEILKKNKIPDWYIESMKKIEYMFPKAHAAAYVLMGWRVAWFKLYKPLEHYATYFTVRAEEFDIKTLCKGKDAIAKKYERLLEKRNLKNELTTKEKETLTTLEVAYEMTLRGFSFDKICIEKSAATEWLIDYKNKKLIPPFTAIEGLGEAVAESIVNARKKAPFTSKEDLQKRTAINKTLFAEMDALGALNNLSNSEQFTLFDD